MRAISYLDFDLYIEGSGDLVGGLVGGLAGGLAGGPAGGPAGGLAGGPAGGPAGGDYRARVLYSPAGQAEATFHQPFSEIELENFYLGIGRTRTGVRGLNSPEMQAAAAWPRDKGQRLFETVFKGEIYACYVSSLALAQQQNKGLRLRIRLKSADLVNLPWEYLYNAPQNRFLCLSVDTPVVRYLDLPHPPETLAVKPPLKILVLVSSPVDFPPLDVQAEKDRLLQCLGSLEQRGLVVVECLEEATLTAMQHALRRGDYHILHFIGHGGFDRASQDGLLVFEDENQRGRELSGQYLGALLANYDSLRLVVLNACEGARTSTADPFAGVAQSLVQQGIPAVIAMQFEITDRAALTFAQEFYTALVEHYPIDAALTEARTAIFAQGNDIEWGTPVYFTRSPDGMIFSIAAPEEAIPAISVRQPSRLVQEPEGTATPVGARPEAAPEPVSIPREKSVGAIPPTVEAVQPAIPLARKLSRRSLMYAGMVMIGLVVLYLIASKVIPTLTGHPAVTKPTQILTSIPSTLPATMSARPPALDLTSTAPTATEGTVSQTKIPPAALDYSEQMGVVRDMGSEGSNVGFVVAAALEFQIKKAFGQGVLISPRDIYYQARLEGGFPTNKDTGAYIRDAISILSQNGVVTEDVWPYKAGEFSQGPPAEIETAIHYIITQSKPVDANELKRRGKPWPGVFLAERDRFAAGRSPAACKDGGRGELAGRITTGLRPRSVPGAGRLFGIGHCGGAPAMEAIW
jgi:hypothetical protein